MSDESRVIRSLECTTMREDMDMDPVPNVPLEV